MKFYKIYRTNDELPYTGRRLENISADVGDIDCDPTVISTHATLEEGLAALSSYQSTACKVDTTTRPIWSLEIFRLWELDEDGMPTGSWDAEWDITQPYASPDLDRSAAQEDLANRYGVKEYNGRMYYPIDGGLDSQEAICADDPIDPTDGTQPIYSIEYRLVDGSILSVDHTGRFITWDDDGTFRE